MTRWGQVGDLTDEQPPRHRGDGQARALLFGAGASMSLMAGVSAAIGGSDGVAGILGAAVMTVGGIQAIRAIDRDEAAAAAYKVLDRTGDRDPGDVFEERWDAA